MTDPNYAAHDPGRTARETDEFLRELSRDLSPVERIARLRSGVLGVIGLWGVLTLAALAVRGLSPTFSHPTGLASGFGVVLVGLSLAGLGGVVAALASSVPGRETTARAASGLLGLGPLLGLGLGGWLLSRDVAAALPPSLGSDARCLSLAFGVAALPALGALLYAVRAAPSHRAMTLAALGAGCVALGAFTAQLGCTDTAFRHLMVSHALAPALGAALFFAPLWLGFRRLRQG